MARNDVKGITIASETEEKPRALQTPWRRVTGAGRLRSPARLRGRQCPGRSGAEPPATAAAARLPGWAVSRAPRLGCGRHALFFFLIKCIGVTLVNEII